MTRKWHPRQYKEGDERGILDLYKLVFGNGISTEDWEWKYKRNHPSQALIILAEADGRVVGQYALLPRLMKVEDNISIGSLSVDTMVHPAYRGQGMFITLTKEAYELAKSRGIHFVYGFPNRNSHHGFITKLDWADLYKGIPLLVKPLNLENILRKRLVDNKLLAGLGDKIGNIAMRALYRSQRNVPVCSVKEISSFDPRFDSLWDGASRGHKIMVIRDKAYLTWRYVEKPGNAYVILIAEKEENLLGYIVLKCMEEFGLQIGFIVDMLTVPEELRVSADLISAALKYFGLRQMDIVGCLMLPCTRYSHSLKQAGFINALQKLLPQDMYLGVRGLSSQYPVTFLTDPNNWFISWGDHDVI